jgi:hypothetical protein
MSPGGWFQAEKWNGIPGTRTRFSPIARYPSPAKKIANRSSTRSLTLSHCYYYVFNLVSHHDMERISLRRLDRRVVQMVDTRFGCCRNGSAGDILSSLDPGLHWAGLLPLQCGLLQAEHDVIVDPSLTRKPVATL